MRRLVIYTSDEFLYRRLKAELSGKYECVCSDESEPSRGDIVIADASVGLPAGVCPDVLLSYGDGTLPLGLGAIEDMLSELEGHSRLTMSKDGGGCILDGKLIHLSELEYALLDTLISHKGGFCPREKLISKVFSGDGAGMLNLYVHYLREKLESKEKRIIISQRKLGYKINEEFLGGGAKC